MKTTQPHSKTGRMVRAAVLAALLAVVAQITIPLGSVPFSMAVFGVALVGLLQPPAWAMASLGAYLALGVCGVPVFAGFSAGPRVLLGPTGGYLLGYFALALALSLAARRLGALLTFLCGLGGMALCYALGTAWFMLSTGSGLVAALALCVAPFALFDAVKIGLATALAAALARRQGVRA